MTDAKIAIEKMVDEMVGEIYREFPFLLKTYGERGMVKTREDLHHHFRHLETAYDLKNDAFFEEYTLWLNGVLTSRGMATAILIGSYERIARKLNAHRALPLEREEAYCALLSKACDTLRALG